MNAQPKRVAIDVWSDVMCPWCAIGYTQLAKAIEQLDGEISAEVRWMPFELNPDLPAEGKSQSAHLAEVYRRSAAELEQMREQMREAAAHAGFSIDYTGSGAGPEPMMWNTFEAHKLLRWALAEKGPEAQTGLSLALFRAHFQERRNVSSREVLLDIAAEQGFDREKAAEALEDEALGMAIRLEERRAYQGNISSVPTFVVNGRYVLQGAQEPEAFREALRKVAAAG